jgi:DNA-binding NarL/FixJ family response regulator
MLITAEADMEVVGEASDGAAAIDAIRACVPEITVMDVSLPSLDGPAATRRLRTECPSVKVLALSAHLGREYLQEMSDAGAWGYVTKHQAADELVFAIRRVARGEKHFKG